MDMINKTIASLILLLMLNAAAVVQQPDSVSQEDSSYNTENSESDSKSLSRQARVIEPVTNTNWSKIKDLFK